MSRLKEVIRLPPYEQDILVRALYEYMLRVDEDLECDFKHVRNNALIRQNPDNLDLMYWIEGNVRLQTTREIFGDVSRIIKMYRNNRSPP